MGVISGPKSVQFFTSLIFKENRHLESAEKSMREAVGSITDRTTSMSFHYTNYYEKEMGSNLSRVFLLFEPLFNRELLPEIKIKTNSIETFLSSEGKRAVNIDPGYISLENVVLATTKGYAHRIYLGFGIFADLTLVYRNGTYKPLEWTYPDYGSEEIIEILKRWRNILKEKLRTHEDRLYINSSSHSSR
jgi:hypothetical protein